MSAKDIIVGTASKAGFFLKKHSPEILLGAGLVSGAAATGFAIKSTMHIDTVIEQHNAMMHKIEMGRKLVENEPESGIVYTENQEAADRQMVYAKTIVAYGKLYAPTILLSAASVVCLLGAFNIMNRRYAGAVAAFSALSMKFEDYRQRVIDKYGAEQDLDFLNGIREIEVENEDGTVEVQRQQDRMITLSGTERYFDEDSPLWDKDNSAMNVVTLRHVIQRSNDMLQRDGHLFLNDVYRMLGLEDTAEGAVLGWIIDGHSKETFVDFGVFNGTDDPWDFANRAEWDGKSAILLHFNCEGIIFDRLPHAEF